MKSHVNRMAMSHKCFYAVVDSHLVIGFDETELEFHSIHLPQACKRI